MIEAPEQEEGVDLLKAEPTKPRQRTDEELRQLCVDIFGGKVFTDRHLNNPNDIGMVFMVVGLGGLDAESEPAMIYEYLDQAGPRSVNGMPMFMSCNVMNIADFQAWFPMYVEYEKAQREFLDNG